MHATACGSRFDNGVSAAAGGGGGRVASAAGSTSVYIFALMHSYHIMVVLILSRLLRDGPFVCVYVCVCVFVCVCVLLLYMCLHPAIYVSSYSCGMDLSHRLLSTNSTPLLTHSTSLLTMCPHTPAGWTHLSHMLLSTYSTSLFTHSTSQTLVA